MAKKVVPINAQKVVFMTKYSESFFLLKKWGAVKCCFQFFPYFLLFVVSNKCHVLVSDKDKKRNYFERGEGRDV